MSLRSFVAGFAGTLVLAAAGQAAAATVVGATRIEITSAIPDYLQIFDVQALELGTLDNVASAAEGASASAVSSGFFTNPGDAIDANILSPYYSGTPDGSEKLTIQLARKATLTSLEIRGRGPGCCQARDFWNVSIFNASNAVLFSGQFDARTGDPGFARVEFSAPTGGIPEPATWAMMILGFGAAGTAIRSRRRATAVA